MMFFVTCEHARTVCGVPAASYHTPSPLLPVAGYVHATRDCWLMRLDAAPPPHFIPVKKKKKRWVHGCLKLNSWHCSPAETDSVWMCEGAAWVCVLETQTCARFHIFCIFRWNGLFIVVRINFMASTSSRRRHGVVVWEERNDWMGRSMLQWLMMMVTWLGGWAWCRSVTWSRVLNSRFQAFL